MPLPDDYLPALEALARAFEAYGHQTGFQAVLVGGAAAAIWTDGRFMSGDFDIVAADDAAFLAAMQAEGFVREHRPGRLLGGFYHDDHPRYGFEQVSGSLFDGRADRNRLVRMVVREEEAGGPAIVLPAIEDMIADRLGQYAAGSPSDRSRLLQARALFVLAFEPDLDYLHRRIAEEGGDHRLLTEDRASTNDDDQAP